MKKLAAFLCLSMMALFAFGQTKTVTGVIIDADGKPGQQPLVAIARSGTKELAPTGARDGDRQADAPNRCGSRPGGCILGS